MMYLLGILVRVALATSVLDRVHSVETVPHVGRVVRLVLTAYALGCKPVLTVCLAHSVVDGLGEEV